MYKKFTGIVFLLLSGCSLHPYTKDELLNTGVTSPEYCLSQERAVVEERVQGYLNHCFHPQVTELTTGGRLVNTIQLKVDSNADRSDMVLWAPTIYGSQFYMNVIVSEKNPACKTTMTAVASGWGFGRNFPKILESANGGDPWCPL
ncbi:hypothetical protein QMK47_04825 [Pseudomonas sp. P9_35]|uniref:hypothetical protein n=1 Tax=unclassified Pseudomonas TaxID=196821 RepID=UPI002A35FF72|nr:MULTISPECIES: hypothetical protein [unclassified Pseudomonas]WPN64325.1 hypothetical protein QMK48_03925 [Pseudomonas sp. P9_32]WPN70076.1 hypothetical protein QMK47_04825 [Pseudomonas sp. P9_35]